MRSDLDRVSSLLENSIVTFFDNNSVLTKEQYIQIIEDSFREIFGDIFVDEWKKNNILKDNGKVISEPQGSG